MKHPENRSLGQLVEINVTGILVFRDNNGIRKVFGNLLARGCLVGFLSEKLLRRMRACKCNWNDESDNEQPVTILRFHRGLSPRKNIKNDLGESREFGSRRTASTKT